MGMFDDLICTYPLPLEGANGLAYQTKDTDAQFLDRYEIREDGTLWHEEYDHEDHSDAARWERENPGKTAPEGLDRFAGCLARVNKRWAQVNITGEISFCAMYGSRGGKLINTTSLDGWLEWSAYFVDGKLNQLHLIENRAPTSKEG